MKSDYYQRTDLQKRFLALLPDYAAIKKQTNGENTFDTFWEACRQFIGKVDTMSGLDGINGNSCQSTDIGKLIFRVYAWLTPLVYEPPENWHAHLAEPPASWADADLSQYHSELMKANVWFGFGGKGSYERAVDASYRQAQEMGFVSPDKIKNFDAVIALAQEYAPFHRFVAKVLEENGAEPNAEYLEMLALGSYKRVCAQIMLEDCQHEILGWFEDIYLNCYEPDRDKIKLDELSPENREMRQLFLDMAAEYAERQAAIGR